MNNVMLFTIALNGYQWHYKSLINSHEDYAKRQGYQHVAVTKPYLSVLGMEVAWLKVSLIIEALNAGYDWVMFLDADTRISEKTPAIIDIAERKKDIYASKGFSGRLNSGVLIIRNSSKSRQFFKQVMQQSQDPLPKEDDVGWGENGHIIHLAKQYDNIHYLDTRWNNNQDISLDDFIRHYSHGPIYDAFKPSQLDFAKGKICHLILALYSRLNKLFNLNVFQNKANQSSVFKNRLNLLTHNVLKHYPAFSTHQ